MSLSNTLPFFTILFLLTFFSCGKSDSPGESTEVRTMEEPLFKLVSSESSGIDFVNLIEESDTLNYYRFMHLYTGAGVASGDLNNDGLPDLFFVSNIGENRCYFNKGDLKFEDVTAAAGLSDSQGFSTGVSMADVNNDGWLDIYLCKSGWFTDQRMKRNLLYINNGDGTFRESGQEYGLADISNSIQASFFDYDKDGDLDMYLVNTPVDFKFTAQVSPLDQIHASKDLRQFNGYDKLYRNDNAHFTEVTTEAGILSDFAFGLSVLTFDVNQDGWTDIYIANDFMTPDYLYINQQDGTFKEGRNDYFKHTSFYSMGSDAGDINNDGLQDLFVLDMLPADYKRSKTSMEMVDPSAFFQSVEWGYNRQYMHNMLHLNNGNASFREIGQMAGVTKTDWSWSPLLADFDNDGQKDLFVTNGIKRDVTERDHKARIDSLRQVTDGPIRFSDVAPLIPSKKIPNYVFHNNGNLTFTDVSTDWGIDSPSFSNGSTAVDLDLDGDLDMVINNVNDLAFVYENQANKTGRNWLQIALKGTEKVHAENAVIQLLDESGAILQSAELLTTRGYHSRSEGIAHFGLGAQTTVAQVEVLWPNQTRSIVKQVAANQRLEISASSAQAYERKPKVHSDFFVDQSKQLFDVPFVHHENEYDDFAVQILLPHRQSKNGPTVAVGDVNGDGLEDFFVGGAHQQTAGLYIQGANSTFTQKQVTAFEKDREYEDMGALFFDADGDNDLDLYVVSGGMEFPEGDPNYQDRLYLNDGAGNFAATSGRLPVITSSGSCVRATDLDQDGDLDLFVGGRVVPNKYPFPAESFILINEGGKFSNKTDELAPALSLLGMVTDATWSDFSGDGQMDLIVTGEWLGIELFENQNGRLAWVSPNYGLEQTKGWWDCVEAVDLDGDGDQDLVAGNLGRNYKFSASEKKPLLVYCADFDNNGTFDVVLAKKIDDTYFPVRGRTCSSEQMPFIKSKFPTFESYADANLEDIYGQQQLESALHYEAQLFESVILWNEGGSFRIEVLPKEAQMAPTNSILPGDFDGDGVQDLLLAGNNYGAEVETTRADAGIGLLLKGSSTGFTPMSLDESGFYAPYDAKQLARIAMADGSSTILVVNNDEQIQAFRVNPGKMQ
ncbi:MAG: VCBS repeat-containing protein [Saprospiraceae bacterium]|nr:VCBS repeat-containing protein [Saprospiraceae bacterium]